MLNAITPTLHTIRRVPFIVWLLIAQLILLIELPAIVLPDMLDSARTSLIIYILAESVFWGLVKLRVPGLQMNLNQAAPGFIGGFVITVFVVSGIQWLAGFSAQIYSLSAAGYLIIFHALVVGVAETLVFQGIFVSLITVVPAQVLFGVAHFAAYGGDWTQIIVATFAGFAFYAIARYVNIFAAMGTHAGFNVAVLRIFRVI